MSHNTWVHKISHAIVVRPLLRTSVTPNQLTTLRLATGIAASALVASGMPAATNVGAGLFFVSIILDRADGDLARQTNQQSKKGHNYDLIADGLCNTMIFLALGYGLLGSSYGLFAPVMGIIAGLSVAGILAYAIHLERQKGPRAGEIGGVCGFDPDDGILAVPIALWLGWTEQLLLAAAIGTPIFATMYFFYFKFLKKTR